jgi:hypothetical protein
MSMALKPVLLNGMSLGRLRVELGRQNLNQYVLTDFELAIFTSRFELWRGTTRTRCIPGG